MAAPVIRRVEWLELFFDLAFVAFITQLATGLHGAPGAAQFLVFITWSIPAWWAWTNVMVGVNLLPTLPPRRLGLALLVAMGFVGLMAASVTEDASRAWAFSLACAGLRLLLMTLWTYRAKMFGHALWRPLVYNGTTSLIWIASAFVPAPWDFALWAVAIVGEIWLMRVSNSTLTADVRVDAAHASERLGLFMIILMGESVVTLVVSLGKHWDPASGIVALIGFVAICGLAWGFFMFGTNAMEQGLERMSATRDFRGLLQTTMILPYLLVVGVTVLAAGLSTAVSSPAAPLPFGAALSLGGGVTLFYLTNTIVSIRWGESWRRLLPWAVPGVLLPLVILLFGQLSATISLACIAALVLAITVRATVAERSRSRAARTNSQPVP